MIINEKQLKCYIYTRVSTSMQVDGYSLEAQKDKLHKYTNYQDMIIAGEYTNEGKSGKSVEGRPQFQQMLQDIETGKDNIDFVLVFKLSRFGRNASDVLSSLQLMQDFGVNLIYEEEQKDGRILKGLRFKFSTYLNGRDVLGVDWDNESTDESVCRISKVHN